MDKSGEFDVLHEISNSRLARDLKIAPTFDRRMTTLAWVNVNLLGLSMRSMNLCSCEMLGMTSEDNVTWNLLSMGASIRAIKSTKYSLAPSNRKLVREGRRACVDGGGLSWR